MVCVQGVRVRDAGSRFEVGMTDEENARFLKDILDESERYYKMLGIISSTKAQALKAKDRDTIFYAINGLGLLYVYKGDYAKAYG